MTRHRWLAFFVLVVLCHERSIRPVNAGDGIRVGVAEVDITPPRGFPMAGYFHERRATGTRDPLKARAIVFQGEATAAALVVCDLTGIARDLTEEVRRRAAAKTGIPAAHIVLSATHSHTAPDYTRALYDYLGDKNVSDAGKQSYPARLIAEIVDAIVAAKSRSAPVVLQAGSARQETPVSFNRRFVMKDGSVRTWARLDDPNVVRAAGPIDPEIGMLLVRAADERRPLAVLSNFALHLDTVGGTLWSGDFPYYIEQHLRASLGADVVSIFAAGSCGDINHIDPRRKERTKTEVIGRSLAQTIAAGLPKLAAVRRPALRVQRTIVRVPLQEVTFEQVARARPVLLEARAGKKTAFFDLVNARKAITLDHLRHRSPHANAIDFIGGGLSRTWAGVGDHLPVEVHVIALGDDVALVCLPGEIFVELGLAIKRASPFRTTMIVELSNCVETRYVPTRVACAGGGYEVANSSLLPGAGEMLAEAAVRLLRDCAPAENKQR